jgi:hypothetical protein
MIRYKSATSFVSKVFGFSEISRRRGFSELDAAKSAHNASSPEGEPAIVGRAIALLAGRPHRCPRHIR